MRLPQLTAMVVLQRFSMGGIHVSNDQRHAVRPVLHVITDTNRRGAHFWRTARLLVRRCGTYGAGGVNPGFPSEELL